MPGASSMRGVTGFRVLDALNGALAQLIPDRIPAAGEGGNTLAIFGADRPEGGDRFVFYELVVGTWGGPPSATATTGSRTRRASPPTSRSRSPSWSSRSSSNATGSFPTRAVPVRFRGGLAIERSWRCLTTETSLIVRSDRPTGRRTGSPAVVTAEPSSNLPIHPDGTRRFCRRCSRPRSRPAMSMPTGWRAAAEATHWHVIRPPSQTTWQTRRSVSAPRASSTAS